MARIWRNLSITQKFATAATAFAVPVAFVVWALVSVQLIAIEFADRESRGAHYLAALAPIQATAALQAIARTGPPPDMARQIADIDARLGAAFGTAATAASVGAVTPDATGLASARARLRSLMVRVGDRSNLILDNVLNTYYLADVALNRLPDALDQIADLVSAQTPSAGSDAEARAQFLVSLGTLTADVDGADASIASAEHATGGSEIAAAIDADYRALRASVSDYVKQLKLGGATTEDASRLVASMGRFNARATDVLAALLDGRVAGLRRTQQTILVVATLLFAAAMLAAHSVVRRWISQPLTSLTAATRRLADDDLESEVPSVVAKDEVGDIGQALAVFRRQLLEARILREAGDAERASRLAHTERIAALAQSFQTEIGTTIAATSGATSSLLDVASQMSGTASRGQVQATSVAVSAVQATANLQAVAAASEELASSLSEITRQVSRSTQITGVAAQDADRTNATMSALSEGAARIGDVVSMIARIAGQTNLLALNATIEAARAGDAGKGFAVVASEVKQLAHQTGKATEDIAAQIEGMRATTQEAVKAIHGITATIGEISDIAVAIAASVHEQGVATSEIATKVAQVAMNTESVTQRIQAVSDATSDTGMAASQVLSTAGEVSTHSAQLTSKLETFIRAINAA